MQDVTRHIAKLRLFILVHASVKLPKNHWCCNSTDPRMVENQPHIVSQRFV